MDASVRDFKIEALDLATIDAMREEFKELRQVLREDLQQVLQRELQRIEPNRMRRTSDGHEGSERAPSRIALNRCNSARSVVSSVSALSRMGTASSAAFNFDDDDDDIPIIQVRRHRRASVAGRKKPAQVNFKNFGRGESFKTVGKTLSARGAVDDGAGSDHRDSGIVVNTGNALDLASSVNKGKRNIKQVLRQLTHEFAPGFSKSVQSRSASTFAAEAGDGKPGFQRSLTAGSPRGQPSKDSEANHGSCHSSSTRPHSTCNAQPHAVHDAVQICPDATQVLPAHPCDPGPLLLHMPNGPSLLVPPHPCEPAPGLDEGENQGKVCKTLSFGVTEAAGPTESPSLRVSQQSARDVATPAKSASKGKSTCFGGEDVVAIDVRRSGKTRFSLNVDVVGDDSESESSGSMEDDEKASMCRSFCSSIVYSKYFDPFFGILVVLNACSIGAQTDSMARNLSPHPSVLFRVIEYIFLTFFLAELILRIFVLGLDFFCGSMRLWNLYDTFVVGSFVLEEIMSAITIATAQAGLPSSLSFLRVLRVLRLARIIRVIRVLRLVRELQTIVLSMISSMRSLLWTIVLLLTILFIVAVYYTQLVLDHRLRLLDTDVALHSPGSDDLKFFFASLSVSILTLYQCITGGVEWNEIVRPLLAEVSVFSGLLFTLYIAFTVLAVLNVITGVFVESAMKNAKEHHDGFLLNHVRQLFESSEKTSDGMVSWSEFEDQLDHTFMHEFFKAIDVDISEAESVFNLLDVDDCGALDLDHLMDGCLRLQGPARSIDLSLLMHETRRMSRKYLARLGIVEHQLRQVLEVLPVLIKWIQSQENNDDDIDVS